MYKFSMNGTDQAFRALADPVRMRIVTTLARPGAICCSAQDQVCACDLEPVLDLTQPTISHHMKVLIEAGLVSARKSGRFVYYRLNRRRFHALAQHLEHLVGEDAATGADAAAA